MTAHGGATLTRFPKIPEVSPVSGGRMWRASNCCPKTDPAVVAAARMKASPLSPRPRRTRPFVTGQPTHPPPAVARPVGSSYRAPLWGAAGPSEGLEQVFMVQAGWAVALPREGVTPDLASFSGLRVELGGGTPYGDSNRFHPLARGRGAECPPKLQLFRAVATSVYSSESCSDHEFHETGKDRRSAPTLSGDHLHRP